ncbi:hypothetical protein IT568_13245 [bacterium]|nr:hypothetical protein [bacterium]
MGIIVVLGCGNSDDGSVTISGKITLSGQQSNSGVKIAFYKLANLNETVVKINEQYPGIGVLATQKTDFDHRTIEAVKVSEIVTNADGSYSLKAKKGIYNFVVEKSGFGRTYQLDFDASKDQKLNFTLIPQDTLTGNIETDSVLTEGNYFLDETLTVKAGVTFTLQSGCQIEAETNSRINVFGTLNILGSLEKPVEIFNKTLDEKWNGISFKSGSVSHIDYLNLSGSFPLTYSSTQVDVKNSTFKNFGGFEISSSSTGLMEKCFLKDTNAENIIKLQTNSSLNFKNNILLMTVSSGYFAFSVRATSGSTASMEISDNCFIGSGLEISGGSTPFYIKKNLFQDIVDTKIYAIFLGANSSSVITDNNFVKNKQNINCYFDSSPTIERNNFLPHQTLVWNIYLSSGLHEGTFIGSTDVNAPNNYWGNIDTPSKNHDRSTAGVDVRSGRVLTQPEDPIQVNNGAPLLD